jgi:Na+-translocating ferredoxin:NAD+ oxidoreductase RnfC subunit
LLHTGEKERQKKLQARLDAMKADGSLLIPGSAAAIAESKKQAEAKAAKEKAAAEAALAAAAEADREEEDFQSAAVPSAAVRSDEEDDWEAGQCIHYCDVLLWLRA